VKWMLFAGMGAWVLRYALFAIGAPAGLFWMIVLGILLHGLSYDFFFVTGQIYVDKKSTPAIRGQAQGFLVLVTYGIGLGVGAQIVGALNNALKGDLDVLSPELWQQFWMYPAGFALAIMIFFAVMFRDRVVRDGGVSEGDVAAAAAMEEGM